MNADINAPVIALREGEVLSLDEAAGKCIVARLGTIWVTEEDDCKDHILGPGESRIVAHGGLTVIQALKPAWVSIRDGAECRAPRH